jgi:hypothetical protein
LFQKGEKRTLPVPEGVGLLRNFQMVPITLRELRETLAKKLIEHFKAGYVVWHDGKLPAFMPQSLANAKNFNGINAVILMLEGLEKGYGDPRWTPYRESLYVKRGEKGVFVEWWNKNEKNGLDFCAILYFNARQLFQYPVADEMSFKTKTVAARHILRCFEISPPSPVSEETVFDSSSSEKVQEPYFDEYDADGDKTVFFKMEDWRTALRTAVKKAVRIRGVPWDPDIFIRKEHLLSLRVDLAVAFLTLSLGMGVSENNESLPLDAWVSSIRQDPSEMARAARDAQKLTNRILGMRWA